MSQVSVGQGQGRDDNESQKSDGTGNKTLGEKATNSSPSVKSRVDTKDPGAKPEFNRQHIPNSSGRK